MSNKCTFSKRNELAYRVDLLLLALLLGKSSNGLLEEVLVVGEQRAVGAYCRKWVRR